MSNYLWTFAKNTNFSSTADTTQVPLLTPTSTGSGTTFVAPVDVVNQFYWTNSKLGTQAGGRQEVPTLILKERRIKTSSLGAQLLYSLGAGKADLNQVSNLIPGVQLPKLGNILSSGATSFLSGVTKVLPSSVQQQITQVSNQYTDDASFLSDPWLKPYKTLYITEKTGWIYYLPFFSNKYQATNNSWGDGTDDSGGQFVMAKAAQYLQDLTGLAGDLLNPNAVGTYQERAKFYQYSKDGDSISLTFPLINAGSATYNDVIRNWQLIYLLLYQNRPERVDVNVVRPPVIYEAEIPGVRYMPLSYMSSIDIEYKGARRTMKIAIPGIGGNVTSTFYTIIPEAYQVSITLTSLIGESKNMLYAAAARSNDIKVYSANQINSLNSPSINTAEQIGAQQQQQRQQQAQGASTNTLIA